MFRTMTQELKFRDLSARHFGITPAVANSYAEAACVCLDRHHAPKVDFNIKDNMANSLASADWTATGDREKAAWNNMTDTTEAGAYAIAIAAAEFSRGLVAISRAETATGSDYYVTLPQISVQDLENCIRLEISGTDKGNLQEIQSRLTTKIQQAKKGNSNLPAIASVVGFAKLQISQADVS